MLSGASNPRVQEKDILRGRTSCGPSGNLPRTLAYRIIARNGEHALLRIDKLFIHWINFVAYQHNAQEIFRAKSEINHDHTVWF